MATAKLTVTVQTDAIRQIDRWVREGRYPNRSRARRAALDLLARRSALPTLEWSLEHARQQPADLQQARDAELQAIDTARDAVEPILAD